MNYLTLIVTKKESVGTITLNRPEKLNGITLEMTGELMQATEQLARDSDVRVVVLTGVGRAFCAGGDLAQGAVDLPKSRVAMDRTRDAGEVCLNLRKMEKPAIAAVNGPAVGGGCNLALACDIIIASEKASFGEVFVRVGLHPDMGGSYFLPRLVGTAKACELIFTGKVIDAREAERIGMVNQVVPHELLETTVMDLARSLAKSSSVALGLSKRSIYQGMAMDLPSALEMEARAQAICVLSEDAKEGARAFLEKGHRSSKADK